MVKIWVSSVTILVFEVKIWGFLGQYCVFLVIQVENYSVKVKNRQNFGFKVKLCPNFDVLTRKFQFIGQKSSTIWF